MEGKQEEMRALDFVKVKFLYSEMEIDLGVEEQQVVQKMLSEEINMFLMGEEKANYDEF